MLKIVRKLKYSLLTDDKQERVRGPPSKIIHRGKIDMSQGEYNGRIIPSAANHTRNYFIELHNQEITTENWLVSIWMANGKQYGVPEPMFYQCDDPKRFAAWFQKLSREQYAGSMMDQVHIWIPAQPFDSLLNWEFVPRQLF